MDAVEHMLHQIVARLKTEVISIMEELHVPQRSLDDARKSNPTLKLKWVAAMNEMSTAVYNTGYLRYADSFWLKRKAEAAEVLPVVPAVQVAENSASGAQPASDERGSKKTKVSQDSEKRSKKKPRKKKKANTKSGAS